MREAVECVSERWCDAVKSMSVQIHVFVSLITGICFLHAHCLRHAEKGMYQCECECECEGECEGEGECECECSVHV